MKVTVGQGSAGFLVKTEKCSLVPFVLEQQAAIIDT